MSLINAEIVNRILFPKHRRKEKAIAQQKLVGAADLSSQQLIDLWVLLGECHKFDKELQLCEEAYLEAIDIIEGLGDERLLGEAYQSLGEAMHFCRDHSKAIDYYEKAADVFKRLDETDKLVNLLSQMAYSYAETEQRDKEIEHLSIASRQPSIQPLVKATLLERVALSLSQSHKTKEAIKTYEQALSLFESEGFKRDWNQRIQSLAQLYSIIGDEVGAKRTLERL